MEAKREVIVVWRGVFSSLTVGGMGEERWRTLGAGVGC